MEKRLERNVRNARSILVKETDATVDHFDKVIGAGRAHRVRRRLNILCVIEPGEIQCDGRVGHRWCGRCAAEWSRPGPALFPARFFWWLPGLCPAREISLS